MKPISLSPIIGGVCTALVAVLLGGEPATVFCRDKPKEPEPYALLYGTCFTSQGFSLPGARVIVVFASEPPRKTKKKKWELFSSPRGEFTIRLPAGKNEFKVTATRAGFRPAEATVSFEADERRDIILKLEPVSEKK